MDKYKMIMLKITCNAKNYANAILSVIFTELVCESVQAVTPYLHYVGQ